MNPNREIKQISSNIWRITRWKGEREDRASMFVREPSIAFQPDSRFQCREDEAGLLTFSLNGKQVLAELGTDMTAAFSIGAAEAIYGLGWHQQQPINRRHMVCQMFQWMTKITPIPFFTSTGGYAVLFDTSAYMSIGIDKPCTSENVSIYEPEESIPNTIQVYADDADTFTYYVILGETMDDQIAGYRLLTGKCNLLPKWAYGFCQSRERYKTQEEILDVAKTFREKHIPIDCIIQDWNYWGDLGWNAMKWDKKIYPDPKAMTDALHDLDLALMVSTWPSFGPDTEICKKLEEIGAIIEKPDRAGEQWGRIYDAYNPKAFDIIWSYIKKNFWQAGVDAWWLDSTEPCWDVNADSRDLLECCPCCLGDNRRYLNFYALQHSRNFYEHQRQESEDKRVVILTRCGYAGQQAVSTITWTGDIHSTWQVFKEQVPSLLSFSASGVPYSTTDIGAFFVDFPKLNQDPEYQEMYTRWFWFGVFSPMFRSHGTSTPREMWYFGEPGSPIYDAQMAACRLRYSLMPYLYANAFSVYQNDSTLMRPLAMDFPQDPKVYDISDSYLFGPSLLVKIITDYQVRKTAVYLPAGADWIDYYTGARYAGGQTVLVDAPIDHIPMFVKAGSLILMTDPGECAVRQDDRVLKLHLYPGADCETFYYQDDKNNYSYEQGNFTRIPICWKEETSTLEISAPTDNADAFQLPEAFEIYCGGKLIETVPYQRKPITLTLA